MGTVLALKDSKGLMWWMVPLLFIGAASLHSASNLINDVEDYQLGFDSHEYPGSSGMFASGVLTMRHIRVEIIISLAVSFACASILTFVRGGVAGILFICGVLAAYGYSGRPLRLKYRGMGDICVFFMMGPGILGGTYYILTGSIAPDILLISFVPGFMVTAVLHSNNIRDMEHDR
ncbi:MAG: prenyltransferase, partial [Chitinivibrionales bacterium]